MKELVIITTLPENQAYKALFGEPVQHDLKNSYLTENHYTVQVIPSEK